MQVQVMNPGPLHGSREGMGFVGLSEDEFAFLRCVGDERQPDEGARRAAPQGHYEGVRRGSVEEHLHRLDRPRQRGRPVQGERQVHPPGYPPDRQEKATRTVLE